MGFYMMIFLAGLQEIPREYYEAARIDGASAWRSFRDITLPLLKPTSFFVLLMSLVAPCRRPRVRPRLRDDAGRASQLDQSDHYYIFQQAFHFSHFGYAAAMASFLVLILLVADRHPFRPDERRPL